jgi:heat shock protein HtpX
MFFNTAKTIMLITGMTALFVAVGNLLGGYNGMVTAGIMALAMNGFAYFFSDRMILSMYRAKQLDQQQYGYIYTIVQELTQRMQIPMPRLYLVTSPIANAFATGRNPSHAAVAVTTGILDILDNDELTGVLAHELSHVKNRDILIGSVAATLATGISYLAYMLRSAAMWGTSYTRDNEQQRRNPLVLLIAGMLLPIAATLIQLAISRSREFQADESGAFITHDPLALAGALEKLQQASLRGQAATDERYEPTSALGIVKPFTRGTLLALFATHPPMEQRIARLRILHQQRITK